MDIKTVTTTTTVLTLTEDEVEHYINHPNELSLELIKSGNHTGHIGHIAVVAPPINPAKAVKRGPYQKRSSKERNSNWATDGNAGHKARGSAVKTSGMARCSGCGKKFKEQGLGVHQHKCPKYQLKQAGIKANQEVLSGTE